MPLRPGRTARSSSRSSKTADAPRDPAGLPTVEPDATAVAVGELGSPHGLRGELRLWPYQPGAPSLTRDRRVLLERDGGWLEATIGAVAAHGRGMLVTLDGVRDRNAAARHKSRLTRQVNALQGGR